MQADFVVTVSLKAEEADVNLMFNKDVPKLQVPLTAQCWQQLNELLAISGMTVAVPTDSESDLRAAASAVLPAGWTLKKDAAFVMPSCISSAGWRPCARDHNMIGFVLERRGSAIWVGAIEEVPPGEIRAEVVLGVETY